MASHFLLNNMSGGEWTPQLDGRIDLQKYSNACKQLVNMRALPWGGVGLRPGTLMSAACRSNSAAARIIPFKYSSSLGYAIEISPDGYLRFFYATGVNAGTQVLSAGVPYEIASPYAAADIFGVKFRQVNGIMYLTHPLYAVRKLVYTSAASWSLAAVAWKYPPLLDQNITQAYTLALGATTGATTLTAVGHTPFVAGHVGSYWELQHKRASTSLQLKLNANGTSAALPVSGDWTFTTSQYWNGTVELQASYDNGATYTTIRSFTSACDGNFSTSGNELFPNIGSPYTLYRVKYTQLTAAFDASVWTGAAPTSYATAEATLLINDAFISSLVQVTGYTSSTVLSVTVLVAAQSTAATYLWSEGAFSDVRGYPAAVDFYEQRILYGGHAYRPNQPYGSVTGDFDNFQYGASDDSALAFQPAVAQQNQIEWIASLLRVHLGTTGEELVMASGNLEESLTPSNTTIRRQSSYGSTTLDALVINNSILFWERNGQRLREMRELSPYVAATDFTAPDLTLFAEHLFSPTKLAVVMDYGRLPDPLLYVVRSDGTMAVLTYNREQNIIAWARYVTQGTFESVAVIDGSPADTVWVTTKRTINGSTKRFVEVFTTDPSGTPDKVNNCLLDCALAVTQASSVTVSGLTYLNGMTVNAVADGSFVPNLVVAGGAVTLPVAATVVRVGLPYVGTLQTMKLDSMLANGTSQGRKRRISQVVVRFKDSLGANVLSSAPGSTAESIPFRTEQDVLGSSPGLFTGDVPVPWPNGIDFDGSVTITQTMPYPITIIGLFPKMDHFGD